MIVSHNLGRIGRQALGVVCWQNDHPCISVLGIDSETLSNWEMAFTFETHAPARAASRARATLSRVLAPPTPATIGTSTRPGSASRVLRVNEMSLTRSSGVCARLSEGSLLCKKLCCSPNELLLLVSPHTQALFARVVSIFDKLCGIFTYFRLHEWSLFAIGRRHQHCPAAKSHSYLLNSPSRCFR